MADRQRDLFPLRRPYPEAGELLRAHHPSRWTRRRLHRRGHWQEWANDAARTLNELAGHSSFASGPQTSNQADCLRRLGEKFESLDKLPEGMSPAGAFRELCHNSLPYLGKDQGPTPYKKGQVSLPGDGAKCRLGAVMQPEHSDLLEGPGSHLLLSDFDAAEKLADSGLRRPYVDPSFQSPVVYGDFLKELDSRGLTSWVPKTKALLGLFFVMKKNGKQRLILDTRVVNCFFSEPPKKYGYLLLPH